MVLDKTKDPRISAMYRRRLLRRSASLYVTNCVIKLNVYSITKVHLKPETNVFLNPTNAYGIDQESKTEDRNRSERQMKAPTDFVRVCGLPSPEAETRCLARVSDPAAPI